MKSQNAKLIFVLTLAALTGRCQKSGDDSSTNYLTEKGYKCEEPSAARLAEVRGKIPNGFISQGFGPEVEVAERRIAGIPDEYLTHMFDRFRQGQFDGLKDRGFNGSTAGLTVRAGSGPEIYVVSMWVARTMVDFALQHEIGHAIEPVARVATQKKGQDFVSGFNNLHGEVGSSPYVRDYARQSPAESWAETFSNFYCSPEAANFITTKLPQSASFVKSVLLPPHWETSPSPGNGSSNGNGNGNAGSSSSDVFMRLDSRNTPDDQSAYLVFSAPDKASSMQICFNESADNCASGNASAETVAYKASAKGRKFFMTSTEKTLSQKDVAVVAKDQNNNILSKKVMRISAK